MRALLVVSILAVPAVATADDAVTTATISIEHRDGWRDQDGKPISVRVGRGKWTKIRAGQVKSIRVKVAAAGTAIAFDAQVPTGKKAFRRWAALVPGASYRVVGNECALWGLEIDGDEHRSDHPERARFDTSGLPAAWFPLVISAGVGGFVDGDDLDAATPGDSTAILDQPGMSAPLVMSVSAMCPRSGAAFTVHSRAARQLRLHETLIGHPGRLHTIKLARNGSFGVVIEPP